MGVYNPVDQIVYIVHWRDAQVFLAEILKRDITIFLANAGFDYYELWSEELEQAASDRRIIDILIRGALKEIATIGFIRTYSLVDACKWHIGYAMDKHEDEGDKAARVTFRRDTPVTEEQQIYLGIDCITTYLCAVAMGPQVTEDTHTLGQIVLTHIRNNGLTVDQPVFDACEKLLKERKEEYRQRLISYGFPDPCKKDEQSEWEVLKEVWSGYINTYFNEFYEESYYLPTAMPKKAICKRLLLYGLSMLKEGQQKSAIARILTFILVQKKESFSKKETDSWNELTDGLDFLVPCDVSRKACVWPTLLKAFLDAFKEKDYKGVVEDLENVTLEHPDWFTDVEPVKPKEFLQKKLHEIQAQNPGLEFAKTPKAGDLKCSKKDQWLLDDFKVKDPFLDAYNNFVHVQKYLSTFCNREHIKADGKVHPRFGIVASGRSSCTGPNIFFDA